MSVLRSLAKRSLVKPGGPGYTDAQINRLVRTGGLQAVATRPNNPVQGLSGTTYTTGQYRTLHTALCNITSLTLVFPGWYGDPSAGAQGDAPNKVTVTVSVEVAPQVSVTGQLRRGYVAGSRTISVEPGANTRCVIGVAIPKGAVFALRPHVQVNAGEQWPTGLVCNYALKGFDNIGGVNATDNGEGDNRAAGGADLTAPGAAVPGSHFIQAYGPAAILGTTSDGLLDCVGFIGDSIIDGSGDYSDCGFMWRALGGAGGVSPTIPYLKLSQPADQAQKIAANSYSIALREGRFELLQFLTSAVCNLGINDVSAGRTLAQIKTDLITVWSLAGLTGPFKLPLWQCTILPKVTTSDGLATLAGQTIDSGNGIRVSLNGWLRDGAPILNGAAAAVGSSAAGTVRAGQTGHPLSGYVETADVVESSRDSGKWRVDLVRTVTDASIASGSLILASTSAAFTSAHQGQGVSILGAGSAGAVLAARIDKVNGDGTATLNKTASTTIASGGTANIGIGSTDSGGVGLHPTSQFHALLAAVIPVKQLAPIAAAAA